MLIMGLCHREDWHPSEEEIMRLLADGHPVTTGMKIMKDFHLYRGGVYQHSECQNCRNADGSVNRWPGNRWCEQDHDITIVGYGEENGVKYWKVKNSWGSHWGENGFGKFLRGVGHCGLGIDYSVPFCSVTSSSIPSPSPNPSPGACGGTLTGNSGTFTSPGYPKAYPNNQDCTWIIRHAYGKTVKLTVMDNFELESGGMCSFDYVEFTNTDGSPISLGNGNAASQGKICGKRVPKPIFTAGNGAIVKFKSDNSANFKGFSIKYETINSNPSCTGQVLKTRFGAAPVILTSPNYPSTYPNNKKCSWTISVPSKEKVRLVFEAFSTEKSMDFVKIYDGATTSSPLLKTLFGNRVPAAITSTGNKLHITFSSDSTVALSGFQAVASAEE